MAHLSHCWANPGTSAPWIELNWIELPNLGRAGPQLGDAPCCANTSLISYGHLVMNKGEILIPSQVQEEKCWRNWRCLLETGFRVICFGGAGLGTFSLDTLSGRSCAQLSSTVPVVAAGGGNGIVKLHPFSTNPEEFPWLKVCGGMVGNEITDFWGPN